MFIFSYNFCPFKVIFNLTSLTLSPGHSTTLPPHTHTIIILLLLSPNTYTHSEVWERGKTNTQLASQPDGTTASVLVPAVSQSCVPNSSRLYTIVLSLFISHLFSELITSISALLTIHGLLLAGTKLSFAI